LLRILLRPKPSAFPQRMCFPRFGGGDRLLGVQVDRRCDVDSVDLIVRDQFAPIRGPFFCTEFSGKTLASSLFDRLTDTKSQFGKSRRAGATRFRAISPAPIIPTQEQSLHSFLSVLAMWYLPISALYQSKPRYIFEREHLSLPASSTLLRKKFRVFDIVESKAGRASSFS